MKTSKVVLALPLLELALALQVFFVFTMLRIDNLVQTLYQYGLQFSVVWAKPYWDDLYVFLTLLVAGSVLLLVLAVRHVQFLMNKAPLKFVGYFLPFLIFGLNGYSYYLFTRIEYIIHHDLYYYGLRFSREWGSQYAINAISGLAFLSLATALTVVTPFLSHFVRNRENREARLKIRELFQKPARAELSKMLSYILITTGFIALFASVFYGLLIVVFVGLGLLFWGVLFTYVRTEEYTKRNVLEAVSDSKTGPLSRFVEELGYRGMPVFLPPRHFGNPGMCRVYIPKHERVELPTPEQMQKNGSRLFATYPSGMLMPPVGLELAKLFEKTLGADFKRVDVDYLQQNLPKLLVENLEIAQNFDIEVEENRVRVEIADSSYDKLGNPKGQYSSSNFRDILVSAIACALAMATDSPVIIEKQENARDGRGEVFEYRIVREVQSKR